MSNLEQPTALYRPQQIPITAHYVVGAEDAQRWARRVAPTIWLLMLVNAIAIVPILWLVSTVADTDALLFGVACGGAALVFLCFRARTQQVTKAERLFVALYGEPGSHVYSRFGPEAFDLESHTQAATYRYETLTVRRTDEEFIVLARLLKREIMIVPRTLVPDDAVAVLRSRSEKGNL